MAATLSTIPFDILKQILYDVCLEDTIIDFFTVCKLFKLTFEHIFARHVRKNFECKVCHVGNNDLRCKCPHSVEPQVYAWGRNGWRYKYKSNITASGEIRHRWDPTDKLKQNHTQDCILNKSILTLNGVCIPCVRDAFPRQCLNCDICFMSVFMGKNAKCPKCLDDNPSKIIAHPEDPPFYL